MRSCTRILAVAIVVAPTAPAFVVPARRATLVPPSRLYARKSEQDRNIQLLQQEIDAAIRQREALRQDLEEEIRSFSERYQKVNANLQNADSRLEEETRSFQKQLVKEKQIIDDMDETIVEKTQQLETIKASSGFLQEAFGAIEGLQGALAPVAALSVVALVGESILRDRKRALQEEKERERRRRLQEAEATQQLDEPPLPGYAKAVRDQIFLMCANVKVMPYFSLLNMLRCAKVACDWGHWTGVIYNDVSSWS